MFSLWIGSTHKHVTPYTQRLINYSTSNLYRQADRQTDKPYSLISKYVYCSVSISVCLSVHVLQYTIRCTKLHPDRHMYNR